MTVGDRVRIIGTSRFQSYTGTISEVLMDNEWFQYAVSLDGYRDGMPIGFMESEVVKREEDQ